MGHCKQLPFQGPIQWFPYRPPNSSPKSPKPGLSVAPPTIASRFSSSYKTCSAKITREFPEGNPLRLKSQLLTGLAPAVQQGRAQALIDQTTRPGNRAAALR